MNPDKWKVNSAICGYEQERRSPIRRETTGLTQRAGSKASAPLIMNTPTYPGSQLKKAPGEGTGPTTHADSLGIVAGRVPLRGEQDVFRRAAREEKPKPELTRRTFIKAGTAAAALSAASWNRVLGANERVGIGVIGFGLVGRIHTRNFKSQSARRTTACGIGLRHVARSRAAA